MLSDFDTCHNQAWLGLFVSLLLSMPSVPKESFLWQDHWKPLYCAFYEINIILNKQIPLAKVLWMDIFISRKGSDWKSNWIVPTSWSWITEPPLVGQAPLWVCMMKQPHEVCRSNRGSAIQWKRVGKYQPYPVRTFIHWTRNFFCNLWPWYCPVHSMIFYWECSTHANFLSLEEGPSNFFWVSYAP